METGTVKFFKPKKGYGFIAIEDPDKDISLYINSPGGVISAGLAIFDTMKLLRCDVSTICVGMSASMATVLLSSGTKGKRHALPNSTIHMHQAIGGAQDQASDIEIAAKEILRMQDVIRTILSDNTVQPYDKIAQDSDRDAKDRQPAAAAVVHLTTSTP